MLNTQLKDKSVSTETIRLLAFSLYEMVDRVLLPSTVTFWIFRVHNLIDKYKYDFEKTLLELGGIQFL